MSPVKMELMKLIDEEHDVFFEEFDDKTDFLDTSTFVQTKTASIIP